ncbi:MAG: ADP-ribosylglycohydrolase family protein [Planctomycetes bacterium]|nr:ADP-ribosylglycohydrolase family protein [Planctomycetota bacterium]
MDLGELRTIVGQEIKQREEEGCDAGAVRDALRALPPEATREDLEALLARAEALPSPLEGEEPSDLPAIRGLRPEGPRRIERVFSFRELRDRVHGAWLGRCAGCQLGKPVENFTKAQVRLAAEHSTGWPVETYFGSIVNPPAEIAADRDWSPENPALLDEMHGAARDDDIDYTILALRILERHGPDFTTDDIAAYWLAHLPYGMVYTAERNAYRNLILGLRPPETARFRNPCREWIGAQIRADMFGYAAPGLPAYAAELAHRDALLSHTKNGIYGELFAAAMVSAAFTTDDIEAVIRTGLSEIPRGSRLAKAIRDTVAWTKEDGDWERTAARIAEAFGGYQGCHTITNAAIVVLALVAGEGDFGRTIATAVMCGFDTDCNGATAGSILGAILGADALPDPWIEPLADRVTSVLSEIPSARISELAERSAAIAASILAAGPRD